MSVSEFKKILSKQPTLSDRFREILDEAGIGGFEVEYRFHPTRRWRFDFAWPDLKVAVECDGIAWQAGGGRHNTDADRDKLNTAASMGWRVLRFSGKQINTCQKSCINHLLLSIHIDTNDSGRKSNRIKNKEV